MTGAVLMLAVSLAVLALLAFAVSAVAFLVQTSRHRRSRRWAATAGASLALLLVFGQEPGSRAMVIQQSCWVVCDAATLYSTGECFLPDEEEEYFVHCRALVREEVAEKDGWLPSSATPLSGREFPTSSSDS